jgi:hypothetical protein
MIREYSRCVITKLSPDDDSGRMVGVPETAAFERLYEKSCKDLGITVCPFADLPPRRFWVLDSPHTRIPRIAQDSARMANMFEYRAKRKHIGLGREDEVQMQLTRDESPSKPSSSAMALPIKTKGINTDQTAQGLVISPSRPLYGVGSDV